MNGYIDAVEFVMDDDADGREPGTYVTLKLDANPRIHSGRVRVEYIDAVREE